MLLLNAGSQTNAGLAPSENCNILFSAIFRGEKCYFQVFLKVGGIKWPVFFK